MTKKIAILNYLAFLWRMEKQTTPDWRKQDTDMPPGVNKIYRDAMLADAWIYHAPSDTWLTPHEFLASWNHFYINSRRHGDNTPEFKIMDPMAGERAHKKKMRDAMAEYLKFRNKMEDYFQFHLKRK